LAINLFPLHSPYSGCLLLTPFLKCNSVMYTVYTVIWKFIPCTAKFVYFIIFDIDKLFVWQIILNIVYSWLIKQVSGYALMLLLITLFRSVYYSTMKYETNISYQLITFFSLIKFYSLLINFWYLTLVI